MKIIALNSYCGTRYFIDKSKIILFYDHKHSSCNGAKSTVITVKNCHRDSICVLETVDQINAMMGDK